VLEHEERILDMVIQIDKVAESGSMASKPTLGIQKKISALQDPDKLKVYHMLHGLANTTSKTDGPIASCKGSIPTGLQNRCNHSFSLGRWDIWLYINSRNSLPVGGR
jgi:hypothetical protein